MDHAHRPRYEPRYDGDLVDSVDSVDFAPPVDETDIARAWTAVQAFANDGKGKAKDVPRLLERTGNFAGAQALMPAIAKRAPGAIVLACAAQLDMNLDAQIALALGLDGDVKEPVSKPELLRHLQRQTEYGIAQVGANEAVVTKLRALFPGPLAHTFPALASIPASMHDQARLVRWYIESTNPTVAALAILRAGNVASLVPTLDALAAWAWLDHVQVAANWKYADQLVVLRDATTTADAKTKLAAFASAVTADEAQREREQTAANAEIPTQLAGDDDAALLGVAARSMMPNVDRKQATARLAGEPAELVLQFVVATDIDTDPTQGIELLLGASADGARTECLRAFMRQAIGSNLVDALSHDRLRSRVRKVIGRDVSLLELIHPSWLEEAHPIVVVDESLRNWAYEDKHARTRLWLAAGSAGAARLGCRQVRADKGNGWVDDLPFDADDLQLRRFVLNSSDAKSVKRVQQRYLHDGASEVAADANDVVAIDSAVYVPATRLGSTSRPSRTVRIRRSRSRGSPTCPPPIATRCSAIRRR